MEMLARQIDQIDMSAVFDVLLHRGVTKYRKTSSKAPFPRQVEESKLDQLSKKGAFLSYVRKQTLRTKA